MATRVILIWAIRAAEVQIGKKQNNCGICPPTLVFSGIFFKMNIMLFGHKVIQESFKGTAHLKQHSY